MAIISSNSEFEIEYRTHVVLFILAVVACKKDVPREELLTSGSLKVVESSLATILGVTFNLNDSLPACAKDDLTIF